MTIAPVDLRQVDGLIGFLDEAPGTARRALSMAMNDILGGSGLAAYRKGVNDQVNFPQGYINDDRLGFDQRASPEKLEASIVARQRPTSLARFATGGTVGGKGGVSVAVQPGSGSKLLKGGFLVRLKAGQALNSDNYNIGLAVRLKPGQTLNKKDQSRMVHLEPNVVLLYGPSVDQVLRNSVIDQETPEVVSEITTEFYRQFARLTA